MVISFCVKKSGLLTECSGKSKGIARPEMSMDTLEERMAKADWYYDYTEDSRVWSKGNQEIKEIIEDLKKIESSEALRSACCLR